jgi:hypothetical protein
VNEKKTKSTDIGEEHASASFQIGFPDGIDNWRRGLLLTPFVLLGHFAFVFWETSIVDDVRHSLWIVQD